MLNYEYQITFQSVLTIKNYVLSGTPSHKVGHAQQYSIVTWNKRRHGINIPGEQASAKALRLERSQHV